MSNSDKFRMDFEMFFHGIVIRFLIEFNAVSFIDIGSFLVDVGFLLN